MFGRIIRCMWLAGLAYCLAHAPAAAQNYTFFEDFQDQSVSDWIVECGSWAFTDGFGGGFAIESTGSNNTLAHQTFSENYGRYHYDMYLDPGAWTQDADLLFQRNGQVFYWLQIGPTPGDNSQDRLSHVSGQATTVVGCASKTITAGSWHQIDVYRYPNGVTDVYIDDLNRINPPRIRTFDGQITTPGTLAIRAHGRVKFDNVAFSPELPPAPEVPPSQACDPLGSYACSSVGSIEWNAASDFSPTSNPAGAWRYGWTTTLGSALTLYTVPIEYGPCPPSSVIGWTRSTLEDGPNIFHNGSGAPIACGCCTWQANELTLHPSQQGHYSVLRWTAPATDVYALDVTFAGRDVDGASTDVHVLHNTTLLFDGIVCGTGVATTFQCDGLALSAGATIDFAVGYGDNADYHDDTTAIAARIVSGAVGGGCTVGSPPSCAPSIQFTSSSYTVSESGTTATMEVVLQGNPGPNTAVDFTVTDGTATSGLDYSASPSQGTLNWGTGGRTRTITIAILNDGLVEGNETVNVSLSGPNGAPLGSPSSATLTIADNERVHFDQSSYSVSEGDGNATITVTRDDDIGSAGVSYSTSNGTASSGSDYTSTFGTLTWNDGDRSPRIINVPILDDGEYDEGDETVSLSLSNPTGGVVLSGPSVASLTIIDNDFPPAGFVKVSGDAAGTNSCIISRPLASQVHEGTLYLWAMPSGSSAAGITGAEFRIIVTNPDGYTFAYTPPTVGPQPLGPFSPEPFPDDPGPGNPGGPPPSGSLVALGNPIDTTPTLHDETGLNLAFPWCQAGTAERVPLGSISFWSFSGRATQLIVTRKSTPSNPNFPFALFALCDAPTYSLAPMNAIDSFNGEPVVSYATLAPAEADAAFDFSTTSNPSGSWSYGWSPTAGGELNVFSQSGPSTACPSLFQWYEPIAIDPAPSISRKLSGPPCDAIQQGDLIMIPGPGGEYSVLRWTPPVPGDYMIDASFTGRHPQGASANILVLHNASTLFSGVVTGTGIPTEFHSCGIAVAAGDWIDFKIGDGGSNYLQDKTAAMVRIAKAPTPTDVDHDRIESIPVRTALHQNVPNPFNPTTAIEFDLERRSHVRLRIFDVAGHLRRTLVDQEMGPGRHLKVTWNGLDEAGGRVSSGVYYYQLACSDFTATRRMVVLK